MAETKNPLQAAWLSVLGVFTQAESELHKATGKLLESLGVPADAAGEHHLAAELMARMRKNRDHIERRIDEGVKTAIARVRAPVDQELAQLRARLERLTQKLDGRAKKKGK